MTDPIRPTERQIITAQELELHAKSLRGEPGACSCVEPAPPAEGEVGELADELGWIAAQLADIGWHDNSAAVARAAALLQQHQSPQSVPVSERLPCAEDCDAEGRCWFHSVGRNWCDWYLLKASCATETETHWLPFHALPLPAGEAGS